MDGAAAMASHPKAMATDVTTAVPTSPKRSKSMRGNGVSETTPTATASSALSTPTASGPSPKRVQTKDAASTRGVTMDVRNSE